MTLRLADLSPSQIRAMARLDDAPAGESIGKELVEMADWELIAAYELIALGLIETDRGWRGTRWFYLTERGRRLREIGWVV